MLMTPLTRASSSTRTTSYGSNREPTPLPIRRDSPGIGSIRGDPVNNAGRSPCPAWIRRYATRGTRWCCGCTSRAGPFETSPPTRMKLSPQGVHICAPTVGGFALYHGRSLVMLQTQSVLASLHNMFMYLLISMLVTPTIPGPVVRAYDRLGRMGGGGRGRGA